MNILIVCQYFYPEEFKVNELAESLVKRGHQVTVLTGKPNYPKGPYPTNYGFWGIQKEEYKGAKIIRVPETTRGNGNFIGLIKSYFSFLISSSIYSIFNKVEAEAIICFQLSPITMALPAIIYKRKCKAKLLHWVQDLWPESVVATTSMKDGLITKFLNKFVKFVYANSDYILIQSKSFKKSICQKGDFENKLKYAPNWADEIFTKEEVYKEENLIIKKNPSDFIVMFAGNIGVAQDFDNIIKAALLTQQFPHIKWVIIGDGRYKSQLVNLINGYKLNDTVKLLGRHSVQKMPSFFSKADIMLVSLKDEYIFSLTIPSKIQAYMAFGKPIVTMLTGEGNKIIEEAQCGMTAESGDYKLLASNIIQMSQLNSEDIEIYKRNAKRYYKEHFSREKTIDNLISLI